MGASITCLQNEAVQKPENARKSFQEPATSLPSPTAPPSALPKGPLPGIVEEDGDESAAPQLIPHKEKRKVKKPAQKSKPHISPRIC